MTAFDWPYNTWDSDTKRKKALFTDRLDLFAPENLKTSGIYQQGKSYQWGFSFLLLLIFLVLAATFSLGTRVMWLDIWFEPSLDRLGRSFAVYQAMPDQGVALKQAVGNDLTNEENNTLQKSLDRVRKEGRIGYKLEAVRSGYCTHAGESQILKQRQNWLRWFLIWEGGLLLGALLIPTVVVVPVEGIPY